MLRSGLGAGQIALSNNSRRSRIAQRLHHIPHRGQPDASHLGSAAQEVHARQGALFAIESLCERLGRLFEPYMVQLITQLLERFGDGAAEVRAANDEASRAVMAALSSHGEPSVKLVAPAGYVCAAGTLLEYNTTDGGEGGKHSAGAIW